MQSVRRTHGGSLYFWRIDRLKTDLRARAVPAREILAYLTAHLVLWTLVLFVPAEETVFTAREAVLMVASVLILVGGLRVAYLANGGAEGVDLAGRLLSIGWVLGLRLMVLWLAFFALVFIVAGVAAASNREIPESAIGSVAWGFALMASLIFFWRLAHHLRDVSRAV